MQRRCGAGGVSDGEDGVENAWGTRVETTSEHAGLGAMPGMGTHVHTCVSEAHGDAYGHARDALEGKRPRRRPQRWLERRSEEVARAVGGGYCRLQMPLKRALAATETVGGHRPGAPEGGGGVPPPLPTHPWAMRTHAHSARTPPPVSSEP